MAEVTEQGKYKQKLADLQKYVPFLQKMIKHLKETREGSREVQLTKMESLYSMITDKNRKLKYDILLKCEEVIVKLQSRMSPASCPKIESTSKEVTKVKSEKDQEEHSNITISKNLLKNKNQVGNAPRPTSNKAQEDNNEKVYLNTSTADTPLEPKKPAESIIKPTSCKAEEDKSEKVDLNINTADTLPATKKQAESTFKPTSSKEQVNKSESEKEPEIKDEINESDSEKMDDFHRNRNFRGRRHVRDSVTYGRKYRPFSKTSVCNQNIILPLLLDAMKSNSSTDSSDIPLQSLDNRSRDDPFSLHSNYRGYSSPRNDLSCSYRDNFNNYYDDNMRMDTSGRYFSELSERERSDYDRINDRRQVWHRDMEGHNEPLFELAEAERTDHDRINDRRQVWHGDVEGHNEHLFELAEAERTDHDRINDRRQVWYGDVEGRSYEQDIDFENSRRSSPAIDDHRQPERYNRRERFESRFSRNHYQPGRRSFWESPRFSSYINENESRHEFYRRNVNDHTDDEDAERFRSKMSNRLLNEDEPLNCVEMQREINIERDIETRHDEHFLKNDPRGLSKNYKNLADNRVSKVHVENHSSKGANNMQNKIEANIRPVNVWENDLLIAPTKSVSFKAQDKIPDNRFVHKSSKLQDSCVQVKMTKPSTEENKSNQKDIPKPKENPRDNLLHGEKHDTKNNSNINESTKTQVVGDRCGPKETLTNTKRNDKNEDKPLKVNDEPLTLSKYDKMYTNLATKSEFVSPLEALYCDNSAPKNFRIPKKQNPAPVKNKKEITSNDISKTVEREVFPIEKASKGNTKKSSINKCGPADKRSEKNQIYIGKTSRIRKKIVMMDNDSDEDINVKKSDENIILIDKVEVNPNKSNIETINSTLFDNVKSEGDSCVDTGAAKRKKTELPKVDNPKKRKTEVEKLSIEKSKEEDNELKPKNDVTIESAECKSEELSQQTLNTDLKSNQDIVDQSAKAGCNTGDKTKGDSSDKKEETHMSQDVEESARVDPKQQAKAEILQEVKECNSQKSNSIDVLEFIMKNYKKIKKIFEESSSSDEEHRSKSTKKKKKKRKKHSSSSSSSSESEEDSKRKTKRRSSSAVADMQSEESDIVQNHDNKINDAIPDDSSTKKLPVSNTNIEKIQEKDNSNVLETRIEAITKPTEAAATKEVKKKTPSEPPKHRKSELDILHESIKEMWMCDDIVRATGKRSCTVSKAQTDFQSVKLKKLESIEKFMENASKLRVIVRREDFSKLLNKNNQTGVALCAAGVIKSKEMLTSKRKSITMENEKLNNCKPKRRSVSVNSEILEDDNAKRKSICVETEILEDSNAKSCSEVSAVTNTFTPTTKPVRVLATDIPSTPTEESKLVVSADTKEVPPSKQESPGLLRKQLTENSQTVSTHRSIRNHHDKNYFVHEDKTSCRLCNFNGKLITPHYKTRHKGQEVLTSRINPSITDLLIVDSRTNHYESMTLSETSKLKYSYKCPFCDAVFNSDYVSTFYDHITTHTGEYRFNCDQCDYSWHNLRFLLKHYRKHNGKIIPPSPRDVPPYSSFVFGYVCKQCYYVQTLKENIDSHVQRYHDKKSEIIKINLNLLAYESPSVYDDILIDTTCNANDDDETDVTVDSFPEDTFDEAADANDIDQTNSEYSFSVKVEDNQIQGVCDREDVNSIGNRNDSGCSTPNLGAFVCDTNIVDQKVEKTRLEKMNEIFESVNIPRASVADKLQNKLDSNETEFIEIPYKSPKKISKTRKLPSAEVVENNLNVQAQKAKPSRTFVAESKQDANSEMVISKKTSIDEDISRVTRSLKPAKLSISSNPISINAPILTGESRHSLIPQVNIANKKLTPISSIINRLQDNLQPTLQKKPGNTLIDTDQLNKNSNSPEGDIQSNEKNELPPPLIHYKELITDDRQPAQASRKTYERPKRKTVQSKKSDQDLPPSLSHYDAINVSKKTGMVIKAGPLKVTVCKKKNMIYSCMDCVFSTSEACDLESHCSVEHSKHRYEGWFCNKCNKVISKIASAADIFMHIKLLHLNTMGINILNNKRAQDDADSVEDSGVENTSNRDSSSSLILQNNTADSKYRFVITSVKSLANELKDSSAAGSVHSEISQNTTSEYVSDNNDKPPTLIKAQNQVTKNSSITKPEYIRPVPISKLLDSAENQSTISMIEQVNTPKPIIQEKTRIATTRLLIAEKVAHFYKCPVFDCSFSCFGNVEFVQHLSLHPDIDDVFCLYCTEVERLSTYPLHLQTSHGNSRYSCSLCFYRATSPTLVKGHIGMVHSQAKKVMIVETPVTTMPQRTVEPYECVPLRSLIKPYVCGEPDCDMETIFGSVFLEHYFTVHYSKTKMTCGLCNDKLFKGILQHYWAIHDIYPYHCRYCPTGSHKFHVVVQHQALRHSNLHICLISRSPKKKKKDSPNSSTDEYDNLQILYENAIALNKINVNEIPPDDITEYSTSLLHTAGVSTIIPSTDNVTVPVDIATDNSEIETTFSANDLDVSSANESLNNIDLTQNSSLECNEQFAENIGDDDMRSLSFPNTTFSSSIEEDLTTFLVPKTTTDNEKGTVRTILPKKKVQVGPKKRHTCVVCSVQFLHKASAIEHMKEFHLAFNPKGQSSMDPEAFLSPRGTDKQAITYYTFVDGTIYPSCNICGLQVTRRRCSHVKALPAGVSPPIDGKITTTCYIYPSLTTVLLRKMVAEAWIIPTFIPCDRYWCGETSCQRKFKNSGAFSRHLRSAHVNDNYYTCFHCGIKIDTQSKLINIYAIHKHFELHGPTLYQCYYCHYLDSVLYSMEAHMNVIHPSRPPKDYHVVRLKGQKSSSTELKSVLKTNVCQSNTSITEKYESVILSGLLDTADEASSSNAAVEEVDPLEIVLSDDSEDGENCKNVVSSDINAVASISNDDMPVSDIVLKNDNTEGVDNIYTDLENDIAVTDMSDNLIKLIDEKLNENNASKEEEVENFDVELHFRATTHRTYSSKNKVHNATPSNLSSTLLTTKDCDKQSSSIETIVIDDTDEDYSIQDQVTSGGNSLELNIKSRELNEPSGELKVESQELNFQPRELSVQSPGLNIEPQELNLQPLELHVQPEELNEPPRELNTQPPSPNVQPQELNVQPPEPENKVEVATKKINFIKPKAFSSKALIEGHIANGPSFSLDLQTLSNKLQKAIGYGQDGSIISEDSIDESNLLQETYDQDGSTVSVTDNSIDESNNDLFNESISDSEDVPVVDGNNCSNDVEVNDNEFTFGRPTGPLAAMSMNCYKCPLCLYETTYSKDIFKHLSKDCDTTRNHLSREHCPIKNRLNWARLVLICQTKIKNFWKDTFIGEELPCRFCPILRSSKLLRKHEDSHFTLKPFGCRYCNFTCLLEKEMRTHWTQFHEFFPYPIYDISDATDVTIRPLPTATSNDLFLMEFLDISDFEDLDEPINSYLQTKMSSLWEFLGNYSPPDTNIRVACRQYLCTKCNKCCYYRDLFKLHMKTHYKAYKCKYCIFRASSFRLLRKHHYDQHSEQNFEFLYDFFTEACYLNTIEDL